MTLPVLTHIDLSKNELRNGIIHNLATAPSAPLKGQMYFNTADNILYWYNGTAWVSASGAGSGVSSVGGTAPIVSSGGTTPNISINAATTGTAGSMSSADKTKLDGATAANTASTIVMRDASGDFVTHNINANMVTGLAAPSSATDATNKNYVDGLANGLDWKASCRIATTANITLSGTQTIDGMSVLAGERVLVKNQTTGSENGIYVCGAGAWLRATDADTSVEVTSGMATFVTEGGTNGDSSWALTTNDPIVLGTTALVFAQVSGLGQVTAGNGLTKTGNTLDVGAGTGITVAADTVSVDTTLIPRKFVGAFTGNGSTTSWAIAHNLGTRDVVVEVYRNATPWDTVLTEVTRTDTNNVAIALTPADTVAYRVVVMAA